MSDLPSTVYLAPPDAHAGPHAWETLVVDGLPWEVAPPLVERLRQTPADVWRTPEAQPGWEQVKGNAARSVWRIEWAGLVCYAKYFRTDDWRDTLRGLVRRPPCAAELDGARFAERVGIPAPRPLACCPLLDRDGGRVALLISAAIEPALTLSEAWLAIRDGAGGARQTHDLLEAVAALIARAHQSGFEHLDMHAGNLLVRESAGRTRACFVDLQSAHLDRPVDDASVVRNLAQLNQWFRRHSDVRVRIAFLRAYLRWRNHFEPRCPHGRPLRTSFRDLVRQLVRQAAVHAQQLWSQRDRRLARRGRYYGRVKLADGWRARVVRGWKHTRTGSDASRRTYSLDWWRTTLDPAALRATVEQANLKRSHSAAVARTELDHADGPLPVVLKRPLARNWQRRLRHALPPSRTAHNWRIGHQLLHRDIPVAAPLALLERWAGPLVRESLLVTEFIPDAEDLSVHVGRARAERSPRAWCRYRRRLATLLAEHVRRLHERGFRHRDCKAENILVVPGRTPRLLWIDLDGIRRNPYGRPASRKTQLAALTRLYVSLDGPPELSRTDRARLLRSYFTGFGRDPRAWRAAWRDIAALADAKRARLEQRRAWKRSQYGRE